jgi:hypothetical protein
MLISTPFQGIFYLSTHQVQASAVDPSSASASKASPSFSPAALKSVLPTPWDTSAHLDLEFAAAVAASATSHFSSFIAPDDASAPSACICRDVLKHLPQGSTWLGEWSGHGSSDHVRSDVHLCGSLRVLTIAQAREHFISTVSRLSQVVQRWNGSMDDLFVECCGPSAPELVDCPAAYIDSIFEVFFSKTSNKSENQALGHGCVDLADSAAIDAAVRSWREGGSGNALPGNARHQAPPYASLLAVYLVTAAKAATAGPADSSPLSSQLADLASTHPSEVFNRILSRKFSRENCNSSSINSSTNDDLSSAAAFAAAAGVAIPQQFSLGARDVLQPHHAPLWAESMGEMGAGLICLQQLRWSHTGPDDFQSFLQQASNLWSHSGILSNYLNLNASIIHSPPSRIRMPAASSQVTSDAWWLPDVAAVSVVAAEDSMWSSEWPELCSNIATTNSWEAAFRFASTKRCCDEVDFSPWSEEKLVSEACSHLVGGDVADDLRSVGGYGSVAEFLICGTSSGVPLPIIESLFAASDVACVSGIASDSSGAANEELLCDMVCNVGAAGGDVAFSVAVAALNCSECMSSSLALQVLSFALSLYTARTTTSIDSDSAAPPSPSDFQRTVTPPLCSTTLQSVKM